MATRHFGSQKFKKHFSGKKRRGREPAKRAWTDSFSIVRGNPGRGGGVWLRKSTSWQTRIALMNPWRDRCGLQGKEPGGEYLAEKRCAMQGAPDYIFRPYLLADPVYDGQGADLCPAGCIAMVQSGEKEARRLNRIQASAGIKEPCSHEFPAASAVEKSLLPGPCANPRFYR